MKIAFHSSYCGYRGTEVALMDYARGNQEILGNQSFFLMPWREDGENHPVTQTMRNIAPLRFYRAPAEREDVLREERADFFYCIKNGWNDGVFSPRIPTGIHAIFRESEFHGDAYAYVSPWLSEVMAYGKAPWVPHMVRLADDEVDFRTGGGERKAEGELCPGLAIPSEATVCGRHGGDDSFDIPWAQATVVEAARKNPNIWFLFLNTREFRGAVGLPNIRFLPATADPLLKRRFINTCDVMLHARQRGETFGLSCLEFATLGKPVLTYVDSPERAHLEILGEAAVGYRNAQELRELLCNLDWVEGWKGEKFNGSRGEGAGPSSGLRVERKTNPRPAGSYEARNSRFEQYHPEAVMKKFQQVFLR